MDRVITDMQAGEEKMSAFQTTLRIFCIIGAALILVLSLYGWAHSAAAGRPSSISEPSNNAFYAPARYLDNSKAESAA